MSSNKTAFLDAKGTPLRIADSPMPVPGPNDIVVKNVCLAINHIDHLMQASGYLVPGWPHVLGSDVAGTVQEVGDSVTRFKVGDRVVGHAWSFKTHKGQDGAFNLYSNLPANNSALIPEAIEFKQAAVLPMAIDTATSGLLHGLGIPLPTLDTKPLGKVIVVYGASSSIGSMATQLATAAGVRVIGVTSAKNHDFVRSCGASEVLDYNEPNFISSVIDAVKKSGDTFVGIYEAVADQTTYSNGLAIFEALGGGRLACCHTPPKDLPENVKATFMFGIGEFSFPLWKRYITPALDQGKLKCAPEPVVVGKGLEALGRAMEKCKAGVSAQKLVVEL